MFSGPTATDATLCLSSQLTVYLGKRDFVDHIDLVDPVGESLEAREEGNGGSGAGQTPSREVCVEAAQGSSSGLWCQEWGVRGFLLPVY